MNDGDAGRALCGILSGCCLSFALHVAVLSLLYPVGNRGGGSGA